VKIEQSTVTDFCAALSDRAGIFSALAERTKTDYSEESIHDFRVSTRRLLMAEILLAPDCKTRKWRKTARRLLKQLSLLRDLQVMQIRFHEEISLAEWLAEDVQREIGQLQEVKRHISIKDLSAKIARSLQLNENELSRQPELLSEIICGIWKDKRADIDRLITDADQEDYRLLHLIRIRTKSLRYITEILLDASIIKDIEIRDFKLWQDFLGNIQDLTVAIRWLEDRGQTTSIRQHLLQEMDQQRIAFWDEKQSLVKLLDRLDSSIANSVLTCSYHSKS